MSRRAKRRQFVQRKGKKKHSPSAGWMKWIGRVLMLLSVVIILSGFALYQWMQKYLRSDDFRVMISNNVGNVIDAEAEFSLFEWQGMDVRTESFKAQGEGVMKQMNAKGLQARLNLAAVKRGVWEISDFRVNELHLVLDTESSQKESKISEVKTEESKAEKEEKKKGFLAGLLPDRAELLSADVMRFFLDLKTADGWLSIDDSMMRIGSTQVEENYNWTLNKATIKSSWFSPKLNLKSAKGKYKRGKWFITDSEYTLYDRGYLTLNGEIEGRDFGFFGTLKDVKARELLPKVWQKRLIGDVQTKFKVRSREPAPLVQGELILKNGVLTNLPVLDTIAAYANTQRFRRLNLSKSSLKYKKQGDSLDLTEIIIASEGLVRMEGNLSVKGRNLNGRFKVGVMPGSLAHIPGAETKVFQRGKNGLLWAPLHIYGTIDDPKEDLSNRMMIAAGERLFEIIPETGVKVLKFAHDTARELPAKPIETGLDVLEGGSDIIQDGVQGVFDLLPR